MKRKREDPFEPNDRFKVGHSDLPPIDEVKRLDRLDKSLDGLLIPDLAKIVKAFYVPFAFALTPLQLEYDVETDTLPDQMKWDLQETERFFERDGDELIRYYEAVSSVTMNTDYHYTTVSVPPNLKQIATDNLRFKCEQWKQTQNVVSVHGPITKPTFTDVSCFIKTQQADLALDWAMSSPYLVSTLLSRELPLNSAKMNVLHQLLIEATVPEDTPHTANLIDDNGNLTVELDVDPPTPWASPQQVIDIIKTAFSDALQDPEAIEIALWRSRDPSFFIGPTHLSKFEALFFGFCDLLDFRQCNLSIITKVDWDNKCFRYWLDKAQEALQQNVNI
jgi:hypothetical protein